MSKEQFDAIYDALGDLEVTRDGYVRWSAVACIQREVGEMARHAGTEHREAHKVMTPEEYAAMPISDWHEVCRDVDGCGGTGVRFLGLPLTQG